VPGAYLGAINRLIAMRRTFPLPKFRLLGWVMGLLVLSSATPPAASDLSLVLRHAGKNTFTVAITDRSDDTRKRFSPPYTIEVRIGDQVQRLLDPATGQPLTLRLSDEQPRTAMCDELTLPGAAPGVYLLRATAMQGGRVADVRPFEVRTQVGCVNPVRTTYMECFLNCEKWEVRW
jgi:hypothetical protein